MVVTNIPRGQRKRAVTIAPTHSVIGNDLIGPITLDQMFQKSRRYYK